MTDDLIARERESERYHIKVKTIVRKQDKFKILR